MGKKQFKVFFDDEAPQIIYADRHVTRGDHGASFFNEGRAGEGATELVADFPKVLGVVQDVVYLPLVSEVIDLPESSVGVASLRRFASPLVEAIEAAALLVADLEQMPVAGPKHLTVHGRMAAHLDLLLAEQASALCRPIASAPAYAG